VIRAVVPSSRARGPHPFVVDQLGEADPLFATLGGDRRPIAWATVKCPSAPLDSHGTAPRRTPVPDVEAVADLLEESSFALDLLRDVDGRVRLPQCGVVRGIAGERAR